LCLWTEVKVVIHTLQVLELPRAAVSPTTLYFVPRTTFNISCYVDGDPKPQPHWFYNGRRIHPDHKYYITFKNDLIVRDPSPRDVGVYECRAVSAAGTHADSATVYVAVAPRVELKQSKTMIGRGDSISFDCIVRYCITKVVSELFSKTDPFRFWKELLSQRSNGSGMGAQDTDAGSYSCVAENIAGRDIGVVKVDVGSMPSIVPSPETVRVNIERQATLQCRAIGHPPPTISWQRDGVPLENIDHSRYTVLPDGNLLIMNAQLEDQTRFTCIAKNEYGQQSKTTMVMIIGLVSPVLGHVPPEEQLIEGEDLRLSCVVVLGTPKPDIKWFKDGVPVEPSSSIIV
ncbi:immunoglobulin I-set domain protein, partial [Ancylostoma caninum]